MTNSNPAENNPPVSRKKKVLALSIGSGLTTAVTVLSSMVFARVLTLEDMATYKQTLLAYNFAVPFLTLGIPSAIYYFLSGAKERERGIIVEHLIMMFTMACVFTLFMLCGGTNLLAMRFSNPMLKETLPLFAVYPLLTFPAMLMVPVLIIYNKVNRSVVATTVLNLLQAVALLLSCWITGSYKVPLLMMIIFAAVSLPVYMVLIFTTIRQGFDFPRLKNLWTILKFAVPLGLASMVGTASQQMGNLLVSSMCTPEAFAVFTLGAIELPLIATITGSITTVVMADMSTVCKTGEKEKALELFRKAAVQSALFLLPVMMFLLFFVKDFILLLYSDKYAASTAIFAVYLLVLPSRIVTFGSAFIALGKTFAIFWRSLVGMVLSIVFCYFGIRLFGITGAALSFILALYLWSVPFNTIYLAKQFRCSVFQLIPLASIGRILLLTFLAGSAAAILYCFPLTVLVRFMIGGCIFCVVYALLAYRFEPAFRQIAAGMLMKIKRKTA